jgi:hypothetical protein
LQSASENFLLGSLLHTEDGGYIPPKRQVPTALHNVTTQNTVLFIVTAVEHSNQTYVNTNSGSFITRYFVFAKKDLVMKEMTSVR